MQFLQQALDDPDPQPCGRCSVCTGELPAPGAAADAGDRGGGPAVLPRPGRDRRAAQALAERPAGPQGQDRRPGGPAGRWPSPTTRPGPRCSPTLWRARRPGAAGGAGRAWSRCCKRWSTIWERPVAVVAMPSRRFPELVGSVAAHVARIGRLPLVEALEVTGPPPTAEASSAVRARDLLARTGCGPACGSTARCCWSTTPSGPAGRDRRRRPAGRGRRDGGAAAGHPPAALNPTARNLRALSLSKGMSLSLPQAQRPCIGLSARAEPTAPSSLSKGMRLRFDKLSARSSGSGAWIWLKARRPAAPTGRGRPAPTRSGSATKTVDTPRAARSA